jgi:hypothetical protein
MVCNNNSFFRLATGKTALELITQTNHPIPAREIIKKVSLAGRLEMLVWIPGRGKVPVSTRYYQWVNNEPLKLQIDLPSEYYKSPYVVSVRLQLSSCYTPRNTGINTDARRLGVQIKDLIWK